MTPIRTLRLVTIQRRQRKRLRARTGLNALFRVLGVLLAVIFILNLIAFSGVVGSAMAVYSSIAQELPEPEQIEYAEQQFETTRIYDRTGEVLLWEIIDPHAGDRVWVPLKDVPEHLICATVAIEDRTFWENPGINPRGILRALWANLRGQQIQGGSSITQQLIKNVLIPPEERVVSAGGPQWRDYARKIKEIILALEITRRYEKEKILEWYLNTNFYGNLAYGIEAAAQVYFGKHAKDLTLAEAATLAAIPQFPQLNPFDAPIEARKRQNIVLDAMVRQGCITEAEAAKAKVEPWRLASPTQQFDFKAPHFSVYVRNELEKMFGADMVYRGGLKVYTTLDYDLQQQAECVARAQIRRLSGEDEKKVIEEAIAAGCEAAQYLPPLRAASRGKDHHVTNAAVVVLRPGTGEILAMVGSLDYWNEAISGRFNAALGLRQPGSAFKPFTYVTLLSQGYTAAHLFWDVRTAFQQPGQPPYVPENYDRKYHGPQRLRLALARSYNIPAVAALQLAGVDNVIRTAHRMGINSLDRGTEYYGLSLTLGGGEVSLLDLAYAYSVFANYGKMIGKPTTPKGPGYRELDPVAILRVEDRYGRVLYEYKPEERQILSPQLAYLMISILSDRQARWAAFGHPNALELSNNRPAAAKTGTTNDFRDNWCVGFTPQILTGVWIGNSDNTEMANLPGSEGAAPIWHAVMEYAHKDLEILPFPRPEGLVEREICATSGEIPTPDCPCPRTKELFIPGTEPAPSCNFYQKLLVNRETGRLCTVFTPPELCEERVYEVYPPEAMDWLMSLPEDQRPPLPPTEYDTIYGPNLADADVIITDPKPYSYIGGEMVPIIGSAKGGDFAFYRIDVGEGMNPTQWIQIGPDHYNQVNRNVLENWYLAGFEGLYTLRLTVVDHSQAVRQYAIQVTVDHTPPTVKLTNPEPGKEYVLGKDEWVNVNADVRDNYAIARVEFYRNDETEPFAVRTIPPYNVNWWIKEVGEQRFRAVVYDAAGNRAESEVVKIRVRPKE
ncbi:MAG: transglycosylase domain-containing protein [Anaerolineae bacterium]|nr:transglycosylase domain-containing protein [Anaerolineae bacterium]MDW7992478.1 transglycosylase domain-containing protein [Anaerolineae bacterium]